MPLSVELQQEGQPMQTIFDGEAFPHGISTVLKEGGSYSEYEIYKYKEEFREPKQGSLLQKIRNWRRTDNPHFSVTRVEKDKEGGPLTVVKWHLNNRHSLIAIGESVLPYSAKDCIGYYSTYEDYEDIATNVIYRRIEKGANRIWNIPLTPKTHLVVKFS